MTFSTTYAGPWEHARTGNLFIYNGKRWYEFHRPVSSVRYWNSSPVNSYDELHDLLERDLQPLGNIDALNATIVEWERAYGESEHQLSAKKGEVKRLRDEVATLTGKINRLNGQVNGLTDQSLQLKAKVDELEADAIPGHEALTEEYERGKREVRAQWMSEKLREVLDATFDDGSSVVEHLLDSDHDLCRRLRMALLDNG